MSRIVNKTRITLETALYRSSVSKPDKEDLEKIACLFIHLRSSVFTNSKNAAVTYVRFVDVCCLHLHVDVNFCNSSGCMWNIKYLKIAHRNGKTFD